MKERNYNYDLLRIVACLMIVCMHAPMPTESANGIFLSLLSYLTAPGLCVFFVLSGALLLPVKTGTSAFLKKRLSKVVMPTVCFSLFYIALNYSGGVDVDWAHSLLSLPFSTQGHGVLWFMYTLVGLYLLAPILSRWLEQANKREVKFYLLLWCVTLCYPILSLFLEVNTSDTGVLYYFHGYAGYFLLGYYLKAWPQALKWRRLALPLAVAFVMPLMVKILQIEVDFYSVFWYLSIFVAILCVAFYKVFVSIHLNFKADGFVQRFFCTTSNLSFGIYLVHIAIMRKVLWRTEIILNIDNYYVQWLVIVFLTFTLSWVVCYGISLLPFGDYIIGYKKRR